MKRKGSSMNIRILVPATVLAALLSSPVLATPNSATFSYTAQKGPVAAERCTQLESQFDSAMATQHPSSKQTSKAQALRWEGTSLCANRQHMAGIKKLEEALNKLGVITKG